MAHRRTDGFYNKANNRKALPLPVLVIGGGILFVRRWLAMKYSLGLDIGITSVGWAVLNLDDRRIEDLGVRAFNAAEEPQTKAPLAEPRRTARGARRRLRRRAGRLRRAKDLFVQFGLIREDERESAFETGPNKRSPWQFRAEGLDRVLTGEEFARALFHMARHRGFKSNRKKVKGDEESKVVGPAIEGNRKLLEGGYRTAGEMLYRDEKFTDRKRNTTNWYENAVDRAMLEEEIKTLFIRQREFGSPFALPELERAFLEVFLWQLPFASGERILSMVGECTFIQGEKRAPKNAYHCERFNLLGKVNSLTYTTDGSRHRLTDEQRRALHDFAYSHAKVGYAQIRKLLSLPEEARFTGLDYIKRKKGEDPVESLDCEKKTFFELKGYHALHKASEKAGVWEQVGSNADLMDDLTHALTFYKTDEQIRDYLESSGVAAEIIGAAANCQGFTTTSNLSLAAIKRILPYLEQGMLYSEACKEAGFDHAKPEEYEKGPKLPTIGPDVTNNPVVRRALSQARKVVNAVIRRYGPPYRVHIELAREIGKSATDRREIQKWQNENRAENERLKDRVRQEFQREPTGENVLKFRLYSDQQCKCAYSQQKIDIERLFEPGYTELDHIVPYSRCFDDSRSNRGLVLTAQNRKKQNRTPFETFGHDAKRWAEFEGWVRTVIRDPRKRNNLLRKEVNEEAWKERSLQDTKYIAREFSRFVRRRLRFADPSVKVPVVCVNGRITARTRGLWGLQKAKDRDKDDLHHALDAAVVASLVQHQITLITEHARIVEVRGQDVDKDTGEIIQWEKGKKPRLPLPWKGFRKELLARLSEDPTEAIRQLQLPTYEGVTDLEPIVVSRMPQRKATGAIHKERIRSAKLVDTARKSAVRNPLTSLKPGDLENLACKATDPRLFEEICRRMEEHGGKADKAFAEPLHKPTNDGSPGPVVKRVKVCQAQYTGIKIRGGIANNDTIAWTDVFRKSGKYYLLPIYVSHVMARKLPDRLVPLKSGRAVDDSYEFLFALFPFDLVWVDEPRKGLKGFFHFRSTDVSDGRITVSLVNHAATTERFSSLSAKAIEKYEMSVLGEYRRIEKEVRRGLANGGDLGPGETEARE